MQSFSTVCDLLKEIVNAASGFVMSSWRLPDQLDLNVGDWEEIRVFFPGCMVASTHLFGMPVQTWSGLRHREFRLRVDGDVVFSQP